ncbi:arabinan endo-1,5-alpha-L-arabinosidase [Pseudochryseolinea flava]|uniref:arabinan endo-1,5-alpha-L-arabinosidase n=1 Tax=Pseudochryseolinea flava TaxID=2059302 RepID=UPI0021CF4E2A|nr:arabinan endo-1,5-alpha-L-arabinosidase [Pseudochryseolinea flava]
MIIFCGLQCKTLAQNIRVHDPVMIKQNGVYYLFCTGKGISVFSSTDMKNWKEEKPVFNAPPAWAVEAVPGFKGHVWAPDVSFHNGKFYLYYSVSAFGKNTSCIGVATNETLNSQEKNFKWVDHGKVIQSVPGRDLWNAIDPNLIYDDAQIPWLVFGSFWSGMKLVKLDKTLTKIADPQEWYTVSKRSRDFKRADHDGGDAAVEAPFIFKHKQYYYLFVSFDYCCKGVDSNYKIMVGRAEKIHGPYVDKDGKRMDEGGGSLLRGGDAAWPGVGHNAVYTFDGVDYLVFHAYDAADQGKPKLKIEKLLWHDDGWPYVE